MNISQKAVIMMDELKNIKKFLKKAMNSDDIKYLFKNITACYMIDYENVMASGLNGIDKLKKGSVVCIFYSSKADRIPMDIVVKIKKAKVKTCLIKTYVGRKNALDFQMVSFLGYLISKHQTMNIKIPYYIISKDTGFIHTVVFWKNLGIDIKKQSAIIPIQTTDTITENKNKMAGPDDTVSEEFKNLYDYLLTQFSVRTADIILDCAINSNCNVVFRENMVKKMGEKFAIAYYQKIKKRLPYRNNPNPDTSKKK